MFINPPFTIILNFLFLDYRLIDDDIVFALRRLLSVPRSRRTHSQGTTSELAVAIRYQMNAIMSGGHERRFLELLGKKIN